LFFLNMPVFISFYVENCCDCLWKKEYIRQAGMEDNLNEKQLWKLMAHQTRLNKVWNDVLLWTVCATCLLYITTI
jgi:hypothetical protein